MHMAILLICCKLWLSLITVHGSHNVDTWINKQKKEKYDVGDTSRLVILCSHHPHLLNKFEQPSPSECTQNPCHPAASLIGDKASYRFSG
jgi:hypothetical protein